MGECLSAYSPLSPHAMTQEKASEKQFYLTPPLENREAPVQSKQESCGKGIISPLTKELIEVHLKSVTRPQANTGEYLQLSSLTESPLHISDHSQVRKQYRKGARPNYPKRRPPIFKGEIIFEVPIQIVPTQLFSIGRKRLPDESDTIISAGATKLPRRSP